jgi:uroporphyrinogen-III synthase
MRVIVTRPALQALPWVARLQALGVDAVALPLIDIAPVEDGTPLTAAWSTLAAQAMVMFVSANAVAHFFAARPPGAEWPGGVLAGSTGPGEQARPRVEHGRVRRRRALGAGAQHRRGRRRR